MNVLSSSPLLSFRQTCPTVSFFVVVVVVVVVVIVVVVGCVLSFLFFFFFFFFKSREKFTTKSNFSPAK